MARGLRYVAYVDESGTNELDSTKSGVSNIFICTAVLVKEKDVADVSEKMRDISRSLCSGAEIKSSKIGKNHERRIRFLEMVSGIDFGYYAVVVNKDLVIKESGLKFKGSFYKFVNRLLYSRIAKECGALHIVADRIGGQDYMQSFDAYFKDKMPNLLSSFTHAFEDSARTPALQLADLVSGTLTFCYDDMKKGPHSLRFREILRNKEIELEVWPPVRRSGTGEVPFRKSSGAIFMSAKNRAIDFIDKSMNSVDGDIGMQAFVVKKLLYHQLFDDDCDECMSSNQLRASLEKVGFEKLSEPAFRNRIIGKIRDAGIIISGTKFGYKLAASEKDIYDYLDHNRKIIEPMLERIKKAKSVMRADLGENIGVFDLGEFEIIGRLVEVYGETRAEMLTRRDCKGDS